MKRLLYALVLVFLCALVPVFAKVDTPPEALHQHVTSHKLVHQGGCTIQHLTAVPCLIFFDEAHDILWIVLFDQRGATHIFAVKDKEEVIVWVRNDLSI